TIRQRIQELVGMPGRSQRTRLGLAIADNTGYCEARIVEHSTKGMTKGISQFPALVDRTRTFGRDMAGNSSGEGKLFEQALQPAFVSADMRIDLRIRPLEISIGHQCRTAMARSADIYHIEIILPDDAVEMDIDEVLTGRSTPVPKQQVLD